MSQTQSSLHQMSSDSGEKIHFFVGLLDGYFFSWSSPAATVLVTLVTICYSICLGNGTFSKWAGWYEYSISPFLQNPWDNFITTSVFSIGLHREVWFDFSPLVHGGTCSQTPSENCVYERQHGSPKVRDFWGLSCICKSSLHAWIKERPLKKWDKCSSLSKLSSRREFPPTRTA